MSTQIYSMAKACNFFPTAHLVSPFLTSFFLQDVSKSVNLEGRHVNKVIVVGGIVGEQ